MDADLAYESFAAIWVGITRQVKKLIIHIDRGFGIALETSRLAPFYQCPGGIFGRACSGWNRKVDAVVWIIVQNGFLLFGRYVK